MASAMTASALEHHRRFVPWADPRRMKSPGAAGHSLTQRIDPLLQVVQTARQNLWSMGPRVTIDETVLGYKGFQFKATQYNPKKPSRHHIKYFAFACGITGFVYHRLLCTGEEHFMLPRGGKAGGFKVELLRYLLSPLAGIQGGEYRTIYWDNYYSSLAAFVMVWVVYSFYAIGAVSLTSKKSRPEADHPFHKLSGGASNSVKAGWMRLATMVKMTLHGALTIVGIMWKGRKIVGFWSTKHAVPAAED